MDNPAISMFNPAISLQVDALQQQEREEEEQEAEEQRRIDAELKEKLEGAFDDIDIEEDGDEDESLASPPNGGPDFHSEVPLKFMTSTPYHENREPINSQPLQYGQLTAGKQQQLRFQEMAIEESSECGGDEDRLDNHHLGQNYNTYQTQNNTTAKQTSNEVAASSDQNNLMVLYVARGREIERLEDELRKSKEEHTAQLRQLRHQLVMSTAEKQHQENSHDQLQQLLADSRRENKVVTEELHHTRDKVNTLLEEKDKLELELEGSREAMTQLQTQIQQLQNSDTVLRARQQHDAVLRSLKERHESETQKLRHELDASQSMLRQRDSETTSLRSKLTELQDRHDNVLRERAMQLEENSRQRSEEMLVSKLENQLKEVQNLRQSDQIHIRNCEMEINQLKNEVNVLEAIVSKQSEEEQVQAASDSIIALGLNGPHKSEGSFRMKDELQRSLASNRSKREQIDRMQLELDQAQKQVDTLRREKSSIELELKQMKDRHMESDHGDMSNLNTNQLRAKIERLSKDLEKAEKDNNEVKRYMAELVESNSQDKMEAIDSLRAEYEDHIKEAVSETKRIMEDEVKRLKIELDVYDKTLVQLRTNLANKEAELIELKKESQIMEKKRIENRGDGPDLIDRVSHEEQVRKAVKEMEEQKNRELTVLVDKERKLIEKEVEDKKDRELADLLEKERKLVQESTSNQQKVLDAKMEQQIEARLEAVKKNMRVIWEAEHKAGVEEAVAQARLDWLRRLPEVEKDGGAARESVGQLETANGKLAAALREKESLSAALTLQREANSNLLSEKERMTADLEEVRRAKEREVAEAETRARSKLEEGLATQLRDTLVKQQQQWQTVLNTNREEAEQQKKRIEARYEELTKQWEIRLRDKEAERLDLENKLDQVETNFGLALEKWKNVLAEKNKVIEKQRSSDQHGMEELRAELSRRAAEADKQREEMASMVATWTQEVKNIQQEHLLERQQLEESREKYRNLKAKVRKYQRHVEAKETHYKEEYNRLEAEFRSTLEGLQTRMEKAYSAKEKEVEQELGNMRHQFTQQLNKIAAKNKASTATSVAGGEMNAMAAVESGDLQQGRHSAGRLVSPDWDEFDKDGSGKKMTQRADQDETTEQLRNYYASTAQQLQKLLQQTAGQSQ